MKDHMYGDGSRDVPLPFRVPKAKHATEGRQKSSPIIAYAQCPHHHEADSKRTGLQWIGTHIVFRDHRYRIGRSMVVCRASGVALCVAPPKDGILVVALARRRDVDDNGERPGRCPHESAQK
jgi:hypothetical protein